MVELSEQLQRELDETVRQISEHAVWKETTNLDGITLLNSTRPSEEVDGVLGDSGDIPDFDCAAEATDDPPKPSQQMTMARSSDSTSTADDAKEAKMNKLFWLIGADHPATAGFKAGRRGVASEKAADFRMCGSSCASSSKASRREAAPDITDADLSTVQFSTRQQRLDWRDFLCEIVATSQVSSLFTLFDVEAEPPRYARPPPSAAFSRGSFSGEDQVLEPPAVKCGPDFDIMSVGTVAQEADTVSEDQQQEAISPLGTPLTADLDALDGQPQREEAKCTS
mmetsp:Transcript_10559/g.24037  ORF Transcript_10559/g.24037 Transcript_10559/m.24037 type:complete len:282 (-) Transcript_10559:85-930(-)